MQYTYFGIGWCVYTVLVQPEDKNGCLLDARSLFLVQLQLIYIMCTVKTVNTCMQYTYFGIGWCVYTGCVQPEDKNGCLLDARSLFLVQLQLIYIMCTVKTVNTCMQYTYFGIGWCVYTGCVQPEDNDGCHLDARSPFLLQL